MAQSHKYRVNTLGCFLILNLLAGMSGLACSGDNITGIWVRISSLKISIGQVDLRIYSEDSDQGELIKSQSIYLSEIKTLDPESENPENQLWVLITAAKNYKDKAISIRSTGLRKSREVAYGSLDGLQFIPDKIIEASQILDLTHYGSDEDEDGFYVPDDCDDSDPTVNPEAQENCNDGLDNNCNGTTDEGCPCESGTTQPCWPHWAGEINGGPCKEGTQKCDGTWGPCDDLVLPNPEGCPDGSYDCFSCVNQTDDDCDGFVDEKDTDCGGCIVDTWEPCYTGPEHTENVGICKFGQKHCIDGTWDMCEGEVLPNGCIPPVKPGQQADCSDTSEKNLCDGFDNDCDGTTDNVTQMPKCSKGCGVCAGAERSCINGESVDCTDSDYLKHFLDTRCEQDNPPACCRADTPDCYVGQETTADCDGLDNDCDCVLDNAIDGVCDCNNGDSLRCPDLEDPLLGICRRGTTDCINGLWKDSDSCVRPDTEICDNKDNNCDGTVDQDPLASADCMRYRKPHTTKASCIEGVCHWDCENGYWDLNNDRNQPGGSDDGDGCEYRCDLTDPANELCDGLDNDCDGVSDSDDQVNIDVLCPLRAHSTRTRCEGPFDCDYTCVDPFEDCNGDLDWQVSTDYDGDGCEKNISNDPDNCGSCNHSCGSGESCSAGNCSCGGTGPDCADTPSDKCCGTQCVNTRTDIDNCGDCNIRCQSIHGTNDCISGNCTPSCDSDWGDCDGSTDNGCETYLWNTSSCGTTCNNLKNCSNEIQNASSPRCDSGQCNYSSCSSSFADCDSNRTNGCEQNIWETTDCGTNCNNRVNCSTQVQNANGKTCSGGLCSYSSCSSGFGDCNNNVTDGCEQNIWETTDCGTNCNNRVNCSNQVQHASGLLCSSGQCNYTSCDEGYADCDGDRSNGCEKDIWETTACGISCTTVNCGTQIQNAIGIFCDTGTCNYSACSSSRYGDCSGGRSDGCETDLYTTTSHCGSCATACVNPNGNTNCSSGTCTPVCNNGSGDCDGNPVNGCEQNIWETTACGTNCNNRVNCSNQVQHASGLLCSSGLCNYTSCDEGYADCDGDRSNGCEKDIWLAIDCSTDCSPGVDCTSTIQNAELITCSNGVCSFASCSSGFGDCDLDPTNGCEEYIWQTADCGTNCNNRVDCNIQVQNATGISCQDGSCDYTFCSSSQYEDCNFDLTDGCERDLWQVDNCSTNCSPGADCTTDVQNATGISCPDGSCSYSSCISSQYEDCNIDKTDGCEADLLGNSTCGADCVSIVDCFSVVVHALNPHCNAGSCDYDSCDGTWGDCNADPTDGCEQALDSNPNCGSCANDCWSDNYDKACVQIGDNYLCGCNNDGDCGPPRPTCNNSSSLCE